MKTIHIRNLKAGESPLIAGVLTDSDVINIEKSMLIPTDLPMDLIELRVDMFNNISTAHIINIFQKARDKFGKPVIATVRDIKEGGQKKINDRLITYKAIIPFSDAVDVEIGSKDIFAEIKKLCIDFKKILIGSYHNFESTPDDSILEGIISKGIELGADIIKIAAMAKNRDDMIRLLMFTLKHKDKGVITMSMGDAGLPSRIISPLFGSLITYGYINTSSAPGQMSAVELMDIFKRLKVRQA